MIGIRNAWIAARARNAARRGAWIAVIGGLAAIAMLSALVWVPRQLDARLARQLAALPPAPDSTPLVERLDSLRALQRALPRLVRPDSIRDSTTLASVRHDSVRAAVTTLSAPNATGSRPDSAAIDLMARVTRARAAPLPDSYRALADAPLLRDDARVRALMDSIDLVDREREAHAALGGPGARYAALTTRLTALGQGLVRIAEQRVARAVLSSIGTESVTSDSVTAPRADVIDSAAIARRDSVREALARTMAQQESLLVSARAGVIERDQRREALERRLRIDVPVVAMVVAALAVGLAFGYGVVLVREVRRPTVGDATEVERLTAAPVLRHTRETASVPDRRARRRDRPGVPRIIDQESDTFVVLHLALTGIGDVVADADVLADDPVIASAVALGTAAAASRESRAVMVIEEPRRTPVLARLLRVGDRRGAKANRVAPVEASTQEITLSRDARIDVQFGDAVSPSPLSHDLRLHLPDSGADEGQEARRARDVIVCVRQGATPLTWLSRTMQQARRRQQRVRAVVLWSRDLPAGS